MPSLSIHLVAALRYPLKTAPLLMIGIFCVLLWLAAQAGLFGLPLTFVLLTGFFNYAYVILERIAVGADEPPVLAIEMMNPVSSSKVLVLLGIAVGAATLSYTLASQSTALGLAAATISVVMLPALIAAQAASDNALQAFNIAGAYGLIVRTGAHYAGLVLLFVVINCAGYFAIAQVGLPLIVSVAVFMYAWLTAFAAIGYLLREYRSELGLDEIQADETIADQGAARSAHRASEQTIDRLYAQWRGGAYANALQSVAEEIAGSADPLATSEWLHQRTSQWPDKRLSCHIARPLLRQLLDAGRTGAALDLLRSHLKQDLRFRPECGDDAIRLARLARDAGDRPTARRLLEDFADSYPRDPAHTTAEVLYRQLER
jgi:hypothetical protein